MNVKFDQTICTMKLSKDAPFRKWFSCECCGKSFKTVDVIWIRQRKFYKGYKYHPGSVPGLNLIFCSRVCCDISKLRGMR